MVDSFRQSLEKAREQGVFSDGAATRERGRAIQGPVPKLPERRPPPPQVEDISVGRQVLDFAKTAADEAIFGLTRPVNTALFGTAYAGKNLMDLMFKTNEPGDVKNAITSGYGQAWQEVDQSLDQSAEELGTYGQIGASVVGGLAPMGPARQVDKAIDATSDLYRSFLRPVGAALKRTTSTAALTGAANMAQSYFQGNTSPEELLMSGAFGAAIGGSVQAALGDNMLPLLRMDLGDTSMTRNFAIRPPDYGSVLSGITDKGMDQSQLSMYELAKRASQPIAPGNILETQIGDAPLYRNWEKLNEFVADLSFPKVDPRTVEQPEIQDAMAKHQDLLKTVGDYRTKVNAEALGRVNDIIQPKGKKAALARSAETRKRAAKLMERMSATEPSKDVPNPLGAQTVNTTAFLDHIEAQVPSAFRRRNMKESPKFAQKMYNAFNDLLRGVDQESVARDFRKIPSQGRDGPRADEIFADVTLAQLMDARTAYASVLTPGMAFQAGMSPAELKAGVSILKLVDKQIDEMTHGLGSVARGEFATAMKTQDAYNMGKTFYSQRKVEVDDQNTFAKFYGEHVDAFVDALADQDPLIEGAFKDGFRDQMSQNIGKRSFHTEMRNLIGDYSASAGEGTGRTKTGNVGTLETILGKEDTKRLLSLYEESDKLAKNTGNLVETLEGKGLDRTQAERLAKLAADSSGIDPSDHRAAIPILRAMISKMLHINDPRKVEAATDLLMARGEPLKNMIETGLEQASGGYPQSVFQLGAAGSTSVDTEDEADGQSPYPY